MTPSLTQFKVDLKVSTVNLKVPSPSGTLVTAMSLSYQIIEDLITSSDSTTMSLNIIPGSSMSTYDIYVCIKWSITRSFKTPDFNVTGQKCYDLHENAENSKEGEGEFSPDLYTRWYLPFLST